MFIFIIVRSDLILGHVRLKTRSLSQIIEKPCINSRGHRFDPKFVKLCQTVSPYKLYVKFETGPCWSKTRSLGQILEKHCVHSKRHKVHETLAECLFL